MNSENREIEVKFIIPSAKAMTERALAAGAVCEQPVQFERNLRFDTPSGELSRTKQVLRLRDNGGKAVLTYKSDKNSTAGLADREEIETEAADFGNARLILERLGYEIFFIYEKYRSVYAFGDTLLFIDHTPIGDYIEIEGPNEDAIRRAAEKLELDWACRIGKGYRALFQSWKAETDFEGRDMTFADTGTPEMPA